MKINISFDDFEVMKVRKLQAYSHGVSSHCDQFSMGSKGVSMINSGNGFLHGSLKDAFGMSKFESYVSKGYKVNSYVRVLHGAKV